MPRSGANRSTNNQGDGTFFDRSAFLYQPESDTYTCPAGRRLVRKQFMRRDNCILYAAQDCSGCALKPRCTSAERRLLTRHFHEDALQRMNARLEADPDLMRQRRCAAEHPFGTIKRMTAGSSPEDNQGQSRNRSQRFGLQHSARNQSHWSARSPSKTRLMTNKWSHSFSHGLGSRPQFASHSFQHSGYD